MSRFPLLLLALIVGSTLTLNAQSRFIPKESWLYQANFDLNFRGFRQQKDRVYRIRIIQVNKDGSADAEAQLLSVAGSGNGYQYNSTDSAAYLVNMLSLPDMQLLYQPLKFKIFPNDSIGEPANVDAVSAVTSAALGLPLNWQADRAKEWKSLPYFLTGAIAPFPAKVMPHYTWTRGQWTYEVEAVSPGTVTITGVENTVFSGQLQPSSCLSYVLSRSTKRVIACTGHIGPSTASVTDSINSRWLPAPAQPALVDTAYYNTLVRLNELSNTLHVRGELDSARVADFLALNRPRYGNRLPFKLAMLNLNVVHSQYIREIYEDVLDSIPSYALAVDPSAVFNKLQHVSSVDADSAMVLIRLLSANKLVANQWVDEVFYQHLIDSPFDTVDARRQFTAAGMSEKAIQRVFGEAKGKLATAQDIIDQMVMEKDSVMQATVKPMAWWNKMNHTTDTAILKKLLDEADSFASTEMIVGKAARYKLLVYDILRKAHLQKEADTLLNKTVADLVYNQSDTVAWAAYPDFQERKYANRQLLAHAYHLKYEQLLPGNKEAALQYLALAAANAPKNNQEKAKESFYDRDFLNAKEDYSQEFAEALAGIGRPEEAIKALSRQLLSQPAMLDNARVLFEKQFPGKSFLEYFQKVVMKEWEQAPDFVLKGVRDEKSFRLSDYKGKWLLLDFWGAWCMPCRRDLPHLSQLAEEMNAGKYPGAALLTIACREPLETTRDFLAGNTYAFPAAHSDNKVENLYKVRGYPTKVLVSPEGKMLDLQFGTDYAAILKMYSNLYIQQAQQPPSTINIKNKKKD